MSEIKLGLGNPPLPVYLYVDKELADNYTYGWHHYDPQQDKKTLVADRALTGYISEIKLTSKDFKGKENLKLDIVIFADELYVVRSGIETIFTKSFLLAASLIEDYNKPLTIVANPGDEKVVFCSIFDPQTRKRIRYQWDANSDWAFLIQSIQSRLSTSPKYELEEENISTPAPPAYPNRIAAPPPINPKSAAVHPQDLRVKQIRTLMDYPVDLIREWLQFQDVKAPSQLPIIKVDELVKTICLAWAADKLDPNHATASYQQQVLNTVVSGTPEIQAIQGWMNYVAGLRTPVSSR
ncbi:conserved hypothetical protein (plasmid) [Trichormus variabilis ATCC 29413]|uniref:Uncharacterized protein n=2 Tax=Anabaena variabilis TaxID=264691 RepID=Q3M213_TRIV2|nr:MULTISPECIES: hypothetical protein [Nostocaceae]ABA24973.1 conserved hypothetical protein [Trichormus variabilis ATCC 29413]MBC1217803.1 hypothetical protein [Trichormus variabilis ARAD]MBC1259083.1 hypothetical protein [Trichormus variabilis V5]MBC1305591.1 hypothetical protein [Trichormus variabilis N2B]MBC1314613.1 hypothetical protein [Trichormus variabilis PNB]